MTCGSQKATFALLWAICGSLPNSAAMLWGGMNPIVPIFLRMVSKVSSGVISDIHCRRMFLMYICGFGLQLNLKADVSKLTITYERSNCYFLANAYGSKSGPAFSKSARFIFVLRLPGLRRTYKP